MTFYIGNPEEQASFWEPQSTDDSCAVVAQMSILNQYIDEPINQDEALYHAESYGYIPGYGTSPDAMGCLLEAYGIPTHKVENASVEQLASELQQGHRVIVGVDSSELWHDGPLGEFGNWLRDVFGLDNPGFSPADHAVSVSGLDLSDIKNPQVIINDSGDPTGAAKLYPLDKFMDAWENSNFNYVATSAPPAPSSVPTGFDIGDFLGLSAGAVAVFAGLDPHTSYQVGELVDSFVDKTDWNALLPNV
jgi:hypothetical protein